MKHEELLERTLKIGSRGSDLARWQADHVRDLLMRQWGSGLKIEICIIETEGDRNHDQRIDEIGGKGVFVKAIEEALLLGKIDVAVHSMKDMPAQLPHGLTVAAMPKREDPRDVLISREGILLAKLPKGAVVGTGSLRRAAMIRRINAGVEIADLRGNVPTRVAKVEQGDMDAVVLAAAGLHRLGLQDKITEYLEIERFCPSPTQGVLAIQCRLDDLRARKLVGLVNDPVTASCAAAERAFMEQLGANCDTPMGCHAELRAPDVLTVSGAIADPLGRPCFIASKMDHPNEAKALGRKLAQTLLELGAAKIPSLKASLAA